MVGTNSLFLTQTRTLQHTQRSPAHTVTLQETQAYFSRLYYRLKRCPSFPLFFIILQKQQQELLLFISDNFLRI